MAIYFGEKNNLSCFEGLSTLSVETELEDLREKLRKERKKKKRWKNKYLKLIAEFNGLKMSYMATLDQLENEKVKNNE